MPVSDRLYPEGALGGAVRELDRRFADSLGVETRVLAYHLVLPHPRLFLPYNNHGVPWFENAATWVGFPFAVRILRRHLSIDEGTAQRARARIARELDLVAERLSDGRPYLTGESFTAADLTFAAMAAIVVFPAEYGVPFPEATSLPEPGRSEILRYRQHEAGKFALRLYRDHRRQIVATN